MQQGRKLAQMLLRVTDEKKINRVRNSRAIAIEAARFRNYRECAKGTKCELVLFEQVASECIWYLPSDGV